MLRPHRAGPAWRGGRVVAALVAAAAIAIAVAWVDSDGGQDHVGHASLPEAGAAQPPQRTDGAKRVLAPTAARRGMLRFDLGRLSRTRIVTARLRHAGAHRPLSARAVSRAARRGVLRVRRPAGWSARRTRLVVRIASRAGVHGCGFGGFRAGTWPAGCWRPYAAASPFNQPLPTAPRLARDSHAVVARILGFGPAGNLLAGAADTTDDYGHPTYYSRPGDPRFRLHCYEASWGACPIEGHLIRVPDAARPAAGGDRHLTVVDQDSGWEYDLYKVASKPAGGGVLDLRWGGRTRIDGDGLRSGATAARFGNLAGIVRAAELAAGRIDHALFLTVRCDAGVAVYPAGGVGRPCAELGLSGEHAPAMGARLQLAMSPAEIDALRVPEWKRTILRAMATYGMYVGDTGGGGWGIKLESGSTYTSFGVPDPLVAFARANEWTRDERLWVGELGEGVDWAHRLRVVDPCVTRRAC